MVSASLLIDLRKIYFYLYKAITRTSRHNCFLCTYKCKHLPVCVPVELEPVGFTRVRVFHISFGPSGRMPLGTSKYRLYLKIFTCIPVDVYLYTCVLDTHLSLDPSGRMPFGTSTYRLRFLRMVSQLTLCWPDRCTVKLR